MKNNIYPKNYHSVLNLVDTQRAIKLIKDTFEKELAKELDLMRVSAPLFVEPGTGLNDNLSGYEKPVSFVVNENSRELEIVQSLAKWKRYALKKYNIDGLYTDMNAIRRFEDLDNLHSLYVDQVLLTKVNADGGAEVFFVNLDENPDFECIDEGTPVMDGDLEIRFTTYRNKNKKEII